MVIGNKMVKGSLVYRIRQFLKIFIEYTIENDTKIYRLKYTPLKIKQSLTKKAEGKFAHYPVQENKIVFDNYMGRGYGCNSKYVTEELLRRRADLDIVWVVKNAEAHKGEFPENVRLVEYLSDQAMKEYYTAKVWVCNYHLVAYFEKGLQKKASQKYIQMWHGSLGIKKIENDCDCLTKKQSWTYLAKKNSENTDYWISNSAFETDVYQRAFWNVKQVLEYGHPRNDLFFRQDMDLIKKKVKSYLGIAPEKRVALYVPTFRESGAFPKEKIDFDRMLESLGQRFGGSWQGVVRLHPRMDEKAEPVYHGKDSRKVIKGDYPDIRELLAAADVVLTDYSSCIFDFLLTGRPAFIYAPDIEQYNDERGFYYKLEKTPFPIAETNRELLENIEKFDERSYRSQTEHFLSEKGCLEDGHAAERVCDLIESFYKIREEQL